MALGVRELAGFVVGEGVLPQERPVLAVVGFERFEDGEQLFGEVGDARAGAAEYEQAAGEAHHEHVAGEVRQMLADEPERLASVAFDHEGYGFGLLSLAAGGAEGELAGEGGGFARLRHVAAIHEVKGVQGAGEREGVVELNRGGDFGFGAVNLGEEAVDALDVALGGGGGFGG